MEKSEINKPAEPIEVPHVSSSLLKENYVAHSNDLLEGKPCLYGNYEIQESEGEELDLQKHYANCVKNPGHSNFIPVTEFSLTHLPEDYRDLELFEFIKAVADLTVRICVNKTNPDRPEFWPDTDKPYPCHNESIIQNGSGEIRVYKFLNGRGTDPAGSEYNEDGEVYASKFDKLTKKCPCKKCLISGAPSDKWWEAFVCTATHVVFDEIEASRTSCRLFFDKEDSELFILDSLEVDYVNIEDDKCVLKFVTCDALGDKLYNMATKRHSLKSKIWEKYKAKSDVKFCFLVSHPHGCPKQVSYGNFMELEKASALNKHYDFSKLIYTVSTCPGSSGASVYWLGFNAGHIHQGHLRDDLNYSGVGLHRKRKSTTNNTGQRI